jgi:hypothetical protein
MPRKRPYTEPRKFTIPYAMLTPDGQVSAMWTIHPTEGSCDGYIDMPNCVLFHHPEFTGITQVPRAVWFDDNISHEAAQLYGVIKNLHTMQHDLRKQSNGTATLVIKRKLIEAMLNVAERTVQVWLQELIDAGHVRREPGHRGVRSNYKLLSG